MIIMIIIARTDCDQSVKVSFVLPTSFSDKILPLNPTLNIFKVTLNSLFKKKTVSSGQCFV